MGAGLWLLFAGFVIILFLNVVTNVEYASYDMRIKSNQLALMVNLVSSSKTDVILPFPLSLSDYTVELSDNQVAVYEGGGSKLLNLINYFSANFDRNMNLNYKKMKLTKPNSVYILKKGTEISINYLPEMPDYETSTGLKKALDAKISCIPVKVGFNYEEMGKVAVCDYVDGYCTDYVQAILNGLFSKGQIYSNENVKHNFTLVVTAANDLSRTIKAKIVQDQNAAVNKFIACMALNMIYEKHPEFWGYGLSTEKEELVKQHVGVDLDIEFISEHEILENVNYGFILEVPDHYLPYNRISEALVESFKQTMKDGR